MFGSTRNDFGFSTMGRRIDRERSKACATRFSRAFRRTRSTHRTDCDSTHRSRLLRGGRSDDPVMRSLLLVPFVLVAACSSSSSASSTGSGCATSTDCSGGLCVVSADFVGGYCTKGCTLNDPSSCPQGSVCIDDASGVPADAGITAVCYQSCSTSADCGRAGYACLEKANHLVCRNGN